MVIERKASFGESRARGTRLVPALFGQRPMIPVSTGETVIINNFEVPIGGNPDEQSRAHAETSVQVHDAITPLGDHSLLYVATRTTFSTRTAPYEDRTESVLCKNEINDPAKPWHGKIRWRDTSTDK